MEIYTERDGAIILQKYAPNNTSEVISYLIKSARALGFEIGVYDDFGAWRGGSRSGAFNDKICIEAEKEQLIPITDNEADNRAFLFIKVVKAARWKTLETLTALAQMASVMLNRGW